MFLFSLSVYSLLCDCLCLVEPLIKEDRRVRRNMIEFLDNDVPQFKRSGKFENDFFVSHDTIAHRQGPPQLKLVDIETYCFGNLEFMQLGPCSSTFLKCDSFTQQRQNHLEECPLGEIFQNTQCRPAYEVKDCFNTAANLLSDATEKLAKATNFCARNSLGTALYSSSESNGPNHKCSRQALLCRHIGEPLAISCPSEKVLDMQTLRCVKAPEPCFFVSNADFAPVRENILHSYCALKLPESQMGAPNNEDEGSALTPQFAGTESHENSHCQNWYVACLAPTVELVFCEDGKLFDYRRRTCRRASAEDQCPHISTCKGWEWRTVSLAECRSDFLFCNGLRPTIFQCQVKGAVFMDGECVVPDKLSNKCSVCQLGERKKAEKCNEFFFCEEHELTGSPHWQSFRCEAPRVFSPFTKECVSASEYRCPNKIDCHEGESFSVNCGDFFYCYEGKYQSGKCPHLTRWDANQRRCISDAACHRFKDDKNENVCQNGEVRPSLDCENFDECVDGKFIKMACHGYSLDRMKAPCRFCQTTENNIDTYPIDSLLPQNFNPFVGQGIRQKHCTDGEKIVNVQDCERYMDCVNGEWFNLACPKGYFFSPKTQKCMSGGQLDCKETRQNSDYSVYYLRPLYSVNETLNTATSTNQGNGAGPMPTIPKNYRDKYMSSFEFCDSTSAKKLPHPHDCSKYKECTLKNSGYYVEKQCPLGTQFDTKKRECKYDYVCVAPRCVEGIREPREKCGKVRRCRNGKWENVRCRNRMAFVNGQCSATISCENSNSDYPHGGQCVHQQAKAHYYDCSKYLLCNYGQYKEENCFNGHKFNPEIGRCDPSYKCKGTYQPDCYENEVRSLVDGKSHEDYATRCDQYEICMDGKFQRQRCPYGKIFDAKSKRCAEGNCYSEEGGDKDYKASYRAKKCKESAGVDGFRPDAANCDKFYQCANGVWVPKDCPANLAFNPSIGVCDWPRNVPGC